MSIKEARKTRKSSIQLKNRCSSLTCDTMVKEEDEKNQSIFSHLSTRSSCAALKSKVGTKAVSEFYGSSGTPIEDEPFYHGYMERTEAERCLTKIGEFLVRKAMIKHNERYIVSIRTNDGVLHLHIQEMHPQKLYWLKNFCFTSVSDLIRYHQSVKAPVYGDDIILKSFVEREQWQLYHEQVHLGPRIGVGELGEVFRGTLTVGFFTKPIDVAVKTPKESLLNSGDRVTFLREANVMLKLRHKHVIRLYGVAMQKEPIMIVMEFASGGTLLERVMTTNVSINRKRKYCYHVFCGMEYLESEQVIHRDLAAKNCLINFSDVCKIGNFGLSLLGQLHKERNMTKAPVRWLAPETLKSGTYSSKSDVWSCGVLMFEVFTNGELPYKQVLALRDVRAEVLRGLRLKPPSDMPAIDAAIMELCFEKNPTARMSFAQLRPSYKSLWRKSFLEKIAEFFKVEKDESAIVNS